MLWYYLREKTFENKNNLIYCSFESVLKIEILQSNVVHVRVNALRYPVPGKRPQRR